MWPNSNAIAIPKPKLNQSLGEAPGKSHFVLIFWLQGGNKAQHVLKKGLSSLLTQSAFIVSS